MTATFAERCKLSTDSLPDAPYRARLEALHQEMLDKIAQAPRQEQQREERMNPRIKEFLARPGLERLNDWASIGPAQKAALEEFVELIVRDCAKITVAIPCPLANGISRQTQGHIWDMACVAAAMEIKKNFGIKP